MLRVQWDSSRPDSPCFPAQADAGRAITEGEHNDQIFNQIFDQVFRSIGERNE
jgi:hypothetical protein